MDFPPLWGPFFFSHQTYFRAHIYGAKKGFHGKVRRAADYRHYCNQLIEKVSRLVSAVETAHVAWLPWRDGFSKSPNFEILLPPIAFSVNLR